MCGQNSVNTSPGLIEPVEQIAQVASRVGQMSAQKVLQNSLKDYFKTISYAHQVKYFLGGLSESNLRDQAVSGASYQTGYAAGLKKCEQSCNQDGQAKGKASAGSITWVLLLSKKAGFPN